MTDYADLTRAELERRLAAAEDFCVMYAWTAAPSYDDDRAAATAELWMRWANLPNVSTDRRDHERLAAAEGWLAEQRRATRDFMLQRATELRSNP